MTKLRAQQLHLLYCVSLILLISSPAKADWEYNGVNYASWTKGEYPSISTFWKAQTYVNSQAITAITVKTDNPYSGLGSLCLDVDLVGGDANRGNGEAYVDLRYWPPQCKPSCCLIAPVDLCGVTVTAKIYCPRGSAGDRDRPNGLQLIFKSYEAETKQWYSFYSNWRNIREGRWNLVEVKLTNTAPPLGYVDPSFDCTRIVLMGIKVGAGEGSTATFRGKMYLDEVTIGDSCRYDFENVLDSLSLLKENHINCVALVVTWYMNDLTSNCMYSDPEHTHEDSKIVETIERIHSLGMGVMLKPHVDIKDADPDDGIAPPWRGLISPQDPNAWFQCYRDFVTHYAQIAQDYGVELFSIGTELQSVSGEDHGESWESLIDDVRAAYGGSLTYAANHDGFMNTNVSIWNRVDFIGLNAYFPLSDLEDPSLEALIDAWAPWVAEIEAWQAIVNKPIIFTEIGYPSADYAARSPSSVLDDGVLNCELQARCYEAVLDVFAEKPWFRGVFWWMWAPNSDAGGCCDAGYTIQNKLAEQILAKYAPPQIAINVHKVNISQNKKTPGQKAKVFGRFQLASEKDLSHGLVVMVGDYSETLRPPNLIEKGAAWRYKRSKDQAKQGIKKLTIKWNKKGDVARDAMKLSITIDDAAVFSNSIPGGSTVDVDIMIMHGSEHGSVNVGMIQKKKGKLSYKSHKRP